MRYINKVRTHWEHPTPGWAWKMNQLQWVAQSRWSWSYPPWRRWSKKKRKIWIGLYCSSCHFHQNTLFGNHITYPIKNGRPALHCDTLKNCEHGKTNVIKGGDTIIGPLPFLQANWSIGFASVGSHGCFEWIVWMTRHAHRSFRDDLFYFRKKKKNQKKIVN